MPAVRIVVQNALFFGRRRLSTLTIPWCTHADPAIAHVGQYVRQARERNIPVRTFTISMHEVDRAIADDEETGFVKIHVRERTDRILGATIGMAPDPAASAAGRPRPARRLLAPPVS